MSKNRQEQFNWLKIEQHLGYVFMGGVAPAFLFFFDFRLSATS